MNASLRDEAGLKACATRYPRRRQA